MSKCCRRRRRLYFENIGVWSTCVPLCCSSVFNPIIGTKQNYSDIINFFFDTKKTFISAHYQFGTKNIAKYWPVSKNIYLLLFIWITISILLNKKHCFYYLIYCRCSMYMFVNPPSNKK